MIDRFRRDITYTGFWLREGSTCTEAWKQWFRWAVIARFRWDVILGEFLVPGREHLQRSLKTMVSASRDEARRGKAHPLHLMLTQACLRLQTKQKPVKRLRIVLSMMLLCIVPGNSFQRMFPPKPLAGSLLPVNIQNWLEVRSELRLSLLAQRRFGILD